MYNTSWIVVLTCWLVRLPCVFVGWRANLWFCRAEKLKLLFPWKKKVKAASHRTGRGACTDKEGEKDGGSSRTAGASGLPSYQYYYTNYYVHDILPSNSVRISFRKKTQWEYPFLSICYWTNCNFYVCLQFKKIASTMTSVAPQFLRCSRSNIIHMEKDKHIFSFLLLTCGMLFHHFSKSSCALLKKKTSCD